MGYVRLQFELSRQESTIVYTAFKYFQKVITNHNKHPSELIAEKIIYDYSLLKNCMCLFLMNFLLDVSSYFLRVHPLMVCDGKFVLISSRSLRFKS